MLLALAALLMLAVAFDLRTHRIPNGLTLAGLTMGLAGHAWCGQMAGLAFALEGVAVAGITLLFWLAGILGAGDVKLLGAVGALMGPLFLLWTLVGAVFAGGMLALPVMLASGLQAGVFGLASAPKTGRMPLAPAIALGALVAFLRLHLRLTF